jgi:hypothetical protein
MAGDKKPLQTDSTDQAQVASIVGMIEYLRKEVRTRSPLTAYLLAMAGMNLLDESYQLTLHPSTNGRGTLKLDRRRSNKPIA